MTKAFGVDNFIQLRDSVKVLRPDLTPCPGPADIWCLVDDFISQFNIACTVVDGLEPQIESEGTMESFAELYRICAHIWPDEEVNTDLASDSYDYSVKKLDELVDYHQRIKDLFDKTGHTYIKNT